MNDAARKAVEAVLTGGKTKLPAKLALTSAEFCADFTPPDYLIEGLLQRRFVYALTAATGTGKTAIALLLAALVDQGAKLGKLEVAKGRVLFFAGENPDDIRMRWLAMTQQFGLTPVDFGAFFVPGVFKFSEIGDHIRNEMANQELALVIIDTSAAYFETDEENNNVQAGAHARRMRELVRLNGGPTVLICCHPVKNADENNLLPRGGGAFLAEIDGNLVCRKDDSAVTLHTHGKFRGPDFEPLNFLLKTVTHEKLKDTKGRTIPTVIAQPIGEQGLADLLALTRDDEDRVLASIGENPNLPQRDRADQLGWTMRNGDPYQMRVRRAELGLQKAKLILKGRAGWEFTDKGQREMDRLLGVSKRPSKQGGGFQVSNGRAYRG